MISTEKIEEWLREVEQRPSSAQIIIQYIGKRVADLSQRNEELLAENIELRSGRKVDDYEKRIAALEYQLNLLKRQLSGGNLQISPQIAQADGLSLLVYTPAGKVIRTEISADRLIKENIYSGFDGKTDLVKIYPRLLAVKPSEELLFVFDSGRTETLAVSELSLQDLDSLSWDKSRLIEPRGGEELSTILPIANMMLKDYCVQASRKGCLKKMMMNSFEGHVGKNFIGTGIKQKPDRTFALALMRKEEPLVLASREGFVLKLSIEQLPYTIEEVLRLGSMDYLISLFGNDGKKSIIVVTENGKVIQRETKWLEPVESFRSKGQPIFSQSRRDAGVRVAGAAAVEGDEWGGFLLSNGQLVFQKVSDLFASGKINGIDEKNNILDFFVCNP